MSTREGPHDFVPVPGASPSSPMGTAAFCNECNGLLLYPPHYATASGRQVIRQYPHAFVTRVVLGTPNLPCEACGLPDRAEVHDGMGVETP